MSTTNITKRLASKIKDNIEKINKNKFKKII